MQSNRLKDILRTVATEKFPFGRILKYGELEIDAAGRGSSDVIMKDVPSPFKLKEIIDEKVDYSHTVEAGKVRKMDFKRGGEYRKK